MALVDHSRNFQNSNPVYNYTTQLSEVFSTPGLHDFLQCFRNYNTHWRIAATNWVISQNFEKPSREARFIVPKSELLRWGRWNSKAHEYISRGPEQIDVYKVFSEYREMVQSFHAWHRGSVLDQYASVIQPCLEYKRLYEGLQKKYSWSFVISHAPQTLNPYEYIGQYPPKRDVEKLLTYKHRSTEQVDALIELIGMDDFCDENLRQKVHSLFRGQSGDD